MKTITGPAGRPVILTKKCPFCGKEHSITVDRDEYYAGMTARERGALIQDSFPNFTPSQRERCL